MPAPKRRQPARKQRSGQGKRSGSIFTSVPLPVPPWDERLPFSRADLEFHGVDHSGHSFEARVFIDNARADLATPEEADAGYAGSFFVFGHGGCFGEEGHCEIPQGPLGAYDRRPVHQLTPQTKIVIATENIKALAQTSAKDFRVTIVPVVPASVDGDTDTVEDILHFDRVTLATYQ